MGQGEVYEQLKKEGKQTTKELAKALNRSKSTINTNLFTLRKRGLIRKETRTKVESGRNKTIVLYQAKATAL